MNYPINYDFGKNWKTKIVPHLHNKKLLKSIHDGVNDYLDSYPGNKTKYRKNTAPASYCSSYGYFNMMERKKDNIIDKLRKEDKLSIRYLRLENKINEMDEEEYQSLYGCRLQRLLWRLKDKITKPYTSWNAICNDIESYILFHSCHFYAPTFELTLANLVEPDEKWSIRTNEKHSTIINETGTKCFDLLYWAMFSRLNNYVFGDPLDNDDLNDFTLGAQKAYIDSA